jgi:hypothetical protein
MNIYKKSLPNFYLIFLLYLERWYLTKVTADADARYHTLIAKP